MDVPNGALPGVVNPNHYGQPANVPNMDSATLASQRSVQPSGYVQHDPAASVAASGLGSYAARSARAYATTGGDVPQSVVNPTMEQPPPVMRPPVIPAAPVRQIADDTAVVQAQQTRILTDCTRKVQEHSYYMKQAMDRNDLPTVLERASFMVGELGEGSSGMLSPKNYYELHMRALDDIPNVEEYFKSLTGGEMPRMNAAELYACVQYCPRVLSRLYLVIAAGSVLMRSQDSDVEWVLNDLIEHVKCVQNPLRGLFLRHFLLQATRDKLPDGEKVQIAIDFVLKNFVEMNKLWVRIQHLPGDVRSKEQRKRRERERNELRILVGTNLVRLSQLEGVTSQVFGTVILPKILEQITVCRDPLAQAYLMDCIIQVFPDEYHIETLGVLLAVCPKLRDKVNVKTILQSLMDRLANYYSDAELLGEDGNGSVKQSVFQEAYGMFEECVKNVFNARGPKLASKEVIRLQAGLLNFSLTCYPGENTQVSRCLLTTIEFVRLAENRGAFASEHAHVKPAIITLDEVSAGELKKMLSLPLEALGLDVLKLEGYTDLLDFLSHDGKRHVGLSMLRAIDKYACVPKTLREIQIVFSIWSPSPDGNMSTEQLEDCSLLSRLIHLIDHEDGDTAVQMLSAARDGLTRHGFPSMLHGIAGSLAQSLVFSTLKVVQRGLAVPEPTVEEEQPAEDNGKSAAADDDGTAVTEGLGEAPTDGEPQASDSPETETSEPPSEKEGEEQVSEEVGEQPAEGNPDSTDTSEQKASEPPTEETATTQIEATNGNYHFVRRAFVFIQETIGLVEAMDGETAASLYLSVAMVADDCATSGHTSLRADLVRVAPELIVRAIALQEGMVGDSAKQKRCVVSLIGALLGCKSLTEADYERLITRTTQCAARVHEKSDQCGLVALCSHLFFPTTVVSGGVVLTGFGTSCASQPTCQQESHSYKNPQRTLECLQRCLKLADGSVVDTGVSLGLFVDILEHYVHFFEKENPTVTHAYIGGLVSLIREQFACLPAHKQSSNTVVQAKAHFVEVVGFIQHKQQAPDMQKRFSEISLYS